MERPTLKVTSRAHWREWLDEHHGTSDGVWVAFVKASAGGKVSYEELVLEALCFGWIDSQGKGIDAEWTSLTFTPRRARSRWTQPNRDRVARLQEAGLMTPAGQAVIDEAQQLGTWDELRQVENLELPDDLASALVGHETAWEALSRSIRYQHLLGLHDAKRPETRARKIAGIIAVLIG